MRSQLTHTNTTADNNNNEAESSNTFACSGVSNEEMEEKTTNDYAVQNSNMYLIDAKPKQFL